MEPLNGIFMFQIKGCKWDFVDIKSVMHTEILFCMYIHLVGSSPLKQGKSRFEQQKILEEENPVSAEEFGFPLLCIVEC